MPVPVATERNSQTSTPTGQAPATADLREESLSTGDAFNRRDFARNALLSFAAVVAGPALAGVVAQEPKAQQSRAQGPFDPKNSDLTPLEKATSQQQERGYFKFDLLEPLLRDVDIKKAAELVDRARDTSLTAESTRLREILEKRYEGIDLKTMEYKGQVGGGRTAITISSNGKSWEERDPLRVMELLLQNNYTDLEGYASRQKAKGMPVPAGFKEAVVEKFRHKVFEFELISR